MLHTELTKEIQGEIREELNDVEAQVWWYTSTPYPPTNQVRVKTEEQQVQANLALHNAAEDFLAFPSEPRALAVAVAMEYARNGDARYHTGDTFAGMLPDADGIAETEPVQWDGVIAISRGLVILRTSTTWTSMPGTFWTTPDGNFGEDAGETIAGL